MPQAPIVTPARFISLGAVAYADADASAVTVSQSSPLPVAVSAQPASPLAGSASTSQVAGPFQPALGSAVILSLSGTWAGTVTVTRSTDGGTTRLPITISAEASGTFRANCCEAVWEEYDPAATLHLDITLTSGSVTYRLG